MPTFLLLGLNIQTMANPYSPSSEPCQMFWSNVRQFRSARSLDSLVRSYDCCVYKWCLLLRYTSEL